MVEEYSNHDRDWVAFAEEGPEHHNKNTNQRTIIGEDVSRKKGGFAFDKLVITSSYDVDEIKSISLHPIDEPLLESATTSQICPFGMVPKTKRRQRVYPCESSGDTSRMTDQSTDYVMADSRDEQEVEVEDEQITRDPPRRLRPKFNRRDTVGAVIRTPSVFGLLKIGHDKLYGASLIKSAAYDMAACETGITDTLSKVTLDDFDDEGPLLLPKGDCVNGPFRRKKHPKQHSKHFKRYSRNPLPSLFSLHFHFRRKDHPEKQLVYHKCRGIGLEAGVSTTTARGRLPSNKPLSRPRKTRKRRDEKCRSQQRHFANDALLHDELDQVMQMATQKQIDDDSHEVKHHSAIVDTLRAPLDAPLSTLYEDDDEDSDILSTVSSYIQISSQCQSYVEYLRRGTPNSTEQGSLHVVETDDERTLLGEKLLDVDNLECDTSRSKRQHFLDTSDKRVHPLYSSPSGASKHAVSISKFSTLLQATSDSTDDEDLPVLSAQAGLEAKEVTSEQKKIGLPVREQNQSTSVYVDCKIAGHGIVISSNPSDVSDLTDCEIPDGLPKPDFIPESDYTSKSDLTQSCLNSMEDTHKPVQPMESRASRLKSLLKRPTYITAATTKVVAENFQSERHKAITLKTKSTQRLMDSTCKGSNISEHVYTNQLAEITVPARSRRKPETSPSPETINDNNSSSDDRPTKIFSDDDDSDDPFEGLYCISRMAV